MGTDSKRVTWYQKLVKEMIVNQKHVILHWIELFLFVFINNSKPDSHTFSGWCCNSTLIPYYNAFVGQLSTHSKQRMHSVPFFLFLELSVTSTSIGHTRLHFPQEIHLLVSHFILRKAK